MASLNLQLPKLSGQLKRHRVKKGTSSSAAPEKRASQAPAESASGVSGAKRLRMDKTLVTDDSPIPVVPIPDIPKGSPPKYRLFLLETKIKDSNFLNPESLTLPGF